MSAAPEVSYGGSGSSTTWSDPQLNFPEFQHAFDIAGGCDQEVRCEDFLNHGADDWQCRRTRKAAAAFLLQPGVGERGKHDVALPPGQRAALEVIEAEFFFELLILLLDRPAMVRSTDEYAQGCGRWQIADVPLHRSDRSTDRALTQEPQRLQRMMLPPQDHRGDTDREKACVPCAARAVAPRHAPPGTHGLRGGPRRDLRGADASGSDGARRRPQPRRWLSDPHGEFPRDTEHVRQRAMVQSRAKLQDIAVSRVGRHQRHLDPGAPHAIDQG